MTLYDVRNAAPHAGFIGCYAAERGRDPEAQLAQDRIDWPGGSMCGFVLWSRDRIVEASHATPEAFYMGRLVDHEAYDEWLAERVKQ